MQNQELKRRQLLKTMGVAALSSMVSSSCAPQTDTKVETEIKPKKTPTSFTYCLNTSTIMGQKVGLEREIEIAAEAGYDGIEIWIPTLNNYIEEGGKLSELNKKITDLNIKVENAIGFAQWIVNDAVAREHALEQAKEEMDLLAQIGCSRIAAPPAGAQKDMTINLDDAAERFAALMDVGEQTGVIPQLEVWGFSENLSKLSEVLYVATASGKSGVKILPDVYHLYKGGSSFEGLKLINGKSIEIFHMNDYPSSPSREEIADKDRVYPGLGVGPVKQVLQDLHDAGGSTVLSLELFNRTYWEQDPLEVAKTGLESMRKSVELI